MAEGNDLEECINEEQSLTVICGNYNFTQIGNSQYANISNLHIEFYVQTSVSTYDVIDINLNEICVSIPYLSTIGASNAFNSAWEDSKVRLFDEVGGNPLQYNSITATLLFKEFLLEELIIEQSGSSFSSAPCDNVPTNEAVYCINDD
ncbi:hypothetical protein [Winogradskyella algicola]|uniref:hypothetical protein n=1 Tax=Winogradskyella algicola TaxID=2575815 RepID=UPI001109E525|nr:hypothetical protein [Winogradskyella algicola]